MKSQGKCTLFHCLFLLCFIVKLISFEMLLAWGRWSVFEKSSKKSFEASKLFDKFVIGKLNVGITKPLSYVLL